MVSFTSPSRASGQKNDRSNVRREEESEGQNCKISLVLKSALPSSDFISSFPKPIEYRRFHPRAPPLANEHRGRTRVHRRGETRRRSIRRRRRPSRLFKTPPARFFLARAFVSLFKRYWGRNDVIRREREKERERKKTATSTPHLNGANGKAFDTDAFAVLTDFAKVGRAVATAAEDAWMANIVGFRVRVSGGDDDTIIGCVSEFFQKKKFNPKLFRV